MGGTVDIEEARKKLDQLTLDVHYLLNTYEEQTGTAVRRIDIARTDITGLDSVRKVDRLAMVQIEATL